MCRIVTVIQAAHVFFCLKVRSSFPFSLLFTDMLLDLKSHFYFSFGHLSILLRLT